MPVTKNPDYYLWVGAAFKWAAKHKGFVAGVCVGIAALGLVWSMTGRSSPPPPVQAPSYAPTPAYAPASPAPRAATASFNPALIDCTNGVQVTIPLGSEPIVMPTRCQFLFDVTAGPIFLKGRDGTVIPNVKAGAKIDWPPGFRLLSMWAPAGGEVTGVFCPEDRPAWIAGRCASAATTTAGSTSDKCPGGPNTISIDEQWRTINPNGCYLYLRVDSGRVILSGPAGDKEVGPEGANLEGWTFYRARAKSGTASFRYSVCLARKQDMNALDCT